MSIENEERTSLADLLQHCRLGTVNMFIKEKREIHRIYQETHKEQLQRTILNLLNLRFHFSILNESSWMSKRSRNVSGRCQHYRLLHIFLTLPARYQVIRAGAKAQLWGWQWHINEKGGGGLRSSGSPFCITVSI